MDQNTQGKFPVAFTNTEIAFAARSKKELQKMRFLFSTMNYPTLVSLGTSFLKLAFELHLPIKGLVKNTLFNHFCGGETIEESRKAIEKLWEYKVGSILDYSVEGEKTDEGFDRCKNEILKTIEISKGKEETPFSVFKVTGLASTPLLEKVSKNTPLTTEEQEAYQRVKNRVKELCQAAFDADVRIFIDAEETWIQPAIDALAQEMMRTYNTSKAIVYNTIQFYTKAGLPKLKASLLDAVGNHYFLGIKLVRGAYMEKERERALEKGYEDPIQVDKNATDQAFNEGLKYCLDNKQRISICAGSHNEYSNQLLSLLMEKHQLKAESPTVFFAQLYGMSDHISYNLSQKGYNVCKYLPYGPVKSVMPYLFRRASENTSIAGQSSRELKLIQEEWKRRTT